MPQEFPAIRLVALDLDGTLLNREGHVTPRTRAALQAAVDKGVYIVPAFTGLGAPYWDMYARGAILGITRGTTQNHIIRAAEESIAYQSADLMWAMEKDTDITISTLKVDGGASRDHFLMQFQSDILNKEVLRPAIRETTALGAAYLAGLATGVWKSREEISHLWICNQLFEPNEKSWSRAGTRPWAAARTGPSTRYKVEKRLTE